MKDIIKTMKECWNEDPKRCIGYTVFITLIFIFGFTILRLIP
jgi:hypothetical protein